MESETLSRIKEALNEANAANKREVEALEIALPVLEACNGVSIYKAQERLAKAFDRAIDIIPIGACPTMRMLTTEEARAVLQDREMPNLWNGYAHMVRLLDVPDSVWLGHHETSNPSLATVNATDAVKYMHDRLDHLRTCIAARDALLSDAYRLGMIVAAYAEYNDAEHRLYSLSTAQPGTRKPIYEALCMYDD